MRQRYAPLRRGGVWRCLTDPAAAAGNAGAQVPAVVHSGHRGYHGAEHPDKDLVRSRYVLLLARVDPALYVACRGRAGARAVAAPAPPLRPQPRPRTAAATPCGTYTHGT